MVVYLFGDAVEEFPTGTLRWERVRAAPWSGPNECECGTGEGPVGPLTRWLVIRFDLEVMEMLSERFADLLSVLGIKLHVELVLGSE